MRKINVDELIRKLLSRLGGKESEEALTAFAGSREGAVLAVAALMASLMTLAAKGEFEDAEAARKDLAALLTGWTKPDGSGMQDPLMRKGLSDLLDKEGSPEALGEDLADFAEEAGILDDLVSGLLKKETGYGD